MIEFILLMVGLAMASYAVWRSLDVTSCQRELKAMERRVNALCNDVMEWQIKTDKLEREAEKFAQRDKEIRDRIIGAEETSKTHSYWINILFDATKDQKEKAEQVAKLIDTITQEIRGDLSVTNVSVEELKVKLIKYQAKQQRIQSAIKENRDALVKWFEGEL